MSKTCNSGDQTALFQCLIPQIVSIMNYGGHLILLISLLMIIDLEEVQAILEKRFNTSKNCIEYKAQWLNYHPSQATWETMENLQHAKEMIDKFNGQAFANELVRPKGIDSMATNGLKANTSNESMGPKRGRGRPPKKLKSFGEPQSPISLDKSSSRQKMHEQSSPVQQEEQKRKRGRPKKIKEVAESDQEFSPEKSINEEDIGEGLSDHAMEERLSYEPDSDFYVLDIRTAGTEFKFLVTDREEKKWMSRKEVVRDHPLALVEFYERHLKVKEREDEGMKCPRRSKSRK